MAHSGKTMTFATDLVPQEDNTYNLGKDDLKWIIRGSLPLSDVTGADDLKAIEAISGTTGLLKKTAANTWTLDTNNYITTATDNILDGSNSDTTITYAPYTASQSKLSFDTSTTAPTRTDRLNLNGFLYATQYNVAGQVTLQWNSTDSSLDFIFA